jgi:tetratricopeptide (TPR) repeat protein
VNAVYELGVRHALRPHATIIIRESAGKLSFDLNHVSTLHYEHLGSDIGNREARRASLALGNLIAQVMAVPKPDSPVYTFLPMLLQPRISADQYKALVDEAESAQLRLGEHIQTGELAMQQNRPRDAAQAFAEALKLKPMEPALIQKLALATYKAELPTPREALLAGIDILSALGPDGSNDPETLGIAGAMHKRLWLIDAAKSELDAAIRYYGRGFELMRDYYNGENLATCYDFRAAIQIADDERTYDRLSARKVRQMVIELLTGLMAQPSFAERSDQKWIHASLANCYFALDMHTDGALQEAAFFKHQPSQIQTESYEAGKKAALTRLAVTC